MPIYKATVRWVAEAVLAVQAQDAKEAYDIALRLGLPWSDAVEGDDGGSTTFSVEDKPKPDDWTPESED